MKFFKVRLHLTDELTFNDTLLESLHVRHNIDIVGLVFTEQSLDLFLTDFNFMYLYELKHVMLLHYPELSELAALQNI